MATCKRCGKEKAAFLSDVCNSCSAELCAPPELRPDGLRKEPDNAAVPPAATDTKSQPATWRGSTELCILLGLACLAIGAYLLIDPTVSVPGYAGIGREKVANIHMMTLGETLSIVGAIFLAAGIRPR